MTLFVLRDRLGNYLARDLSWTTAEAVTTWFQTPHKDIALNQLQELNAKDVDLRAQVVLCDLDAKSRPVIPDPG